MSIELSNSYNDVIKLIEHSKNKVNTYVNSELIDLYWKIGEYVSDKTNAEGWGRKTVEILADFLSKNYPDTKGFSSQNIWRMKRFFETYKDDAILSPLVRELNWTNNLEIFSRSKSDEEREFYIRMTNKKNEIVDVLA